MDLVFRTAAIFIFILFVTRVTGRRELNSLEPYDIIVLVVLGDLVQQGVTQSDNSVTGAIIVISTIMVLSVVTGWLGTARSVSTASCCRSGGSTATSAWAVTSSWARLRASRWRTRRAMTSAPPRRRS